MSDKPSHQGLAAPRKFMPDVKPLESRLLLSTAVPDFGGDFGRSDVFPDGTSLVSPALPHLPRTGGVFVQTGTVLAIGVGQPTTNTVHATDDGGGAFTVEWNGDPVHSLTGVASTVIQARRAKSGQIMFNLAGPRTVGTAVAVGSVVPTDAAAASDEGHSQKVEKRKAGGHAVQSSSVLTVTVNKPLSNAVLISNYGGGAVAVEWNGGAVHSFTGVATIFVDTHNARKDLVALHDPGPTEE